MRALGALWAVVLLALVAGGIALQVLGPPPGRAVAEAKGRAGPVAPPPDTRPPRLRYAARVEAGDRRPRVALVLAGIGLSANDSAQALAALPTAVTVALSPYATEEERRADLAALRGRGRECLLSVPMEPQGYPLVDEGDRELLAGAPAERNAADLDWALTRPGECVGATGASDGLYGERFARSGVAFRTALETVAARGLLYLSPVVGEPVPGGLGRAVDLVVDAPPRPGVSADAGAIDAALARLETLAVTQGVAVGLAGPPHPATVERIAFWAGGLASRGVALVPVSAAFGQAAGSARAEAAAPPGGPAETGRP